MMYIYLLENDKVRGYDTYDSCVVVAGSPEEARSIHPYNWCNENGAIEELTTVETSNWCALKDVKLTNIGRAKGFIKSCVICASYNAG